MEDQMTALGFDRDPFVVVAAVGESLAYVGRYVQCVRVLRSAMHLAAAATCSRCSRPCSPRNDNANYCCGPPTSGRIGSSSSPLSSASASSPIAGDSGTESSSPLPSLIQAVKCNHLPVEEAAVGCSARYLVIDWTLSCLVLAYWTLGDREQAVQFARRRLTVAELRGTTL
jgi:hypothetical protein